MNEIHDDERMWCRLQPTARYAAAAVFSVFGDPESARLLVPDTSDGVTERQRNLRLRVLSKLLAKFLSDNSANGVLQHKAAQVRTCAPPPCRTSQQKRAGAKRVLKTLPLLCLNLRKIMSRAVPSMLLICNVRASVR